ncbi:HD domain-containing protein [candidate division WOR-3 bacterium]|nr:HD domain-containing protein [candidate division WOR-3 bacterium]
MSDVNGILDYRYFFPEKPEDIYEQSRKAIKSAYPDFDMSGLKKVFEDILDLFDGKFPGYRKCTTKYHDLSHTLSVYLASSRLIDGAARSGIRFKDEYIRLSLISSLFHDVGYIQRTEDESGTGAKFSVGHEERSIVFASNYLGEKGYTNFDRMRASHIIASTILELPIDEIPFHSDELKFLGKIVGTSDLVAQIADRFYLEKLLFLFREFSEAGIPGFPSEIDLLKNTETFYKDVSKNKIYGEYQGVFDLVEGHFESNFGIKINPYKKYMEKNLKYLGNILTNCESDYRSLLRRGGIVEMLKREESANPLVRKGFKR